MDYTSEQMLQNFLDKYVDMGDHPTVRIELEKIISIIVTEAVTNYFDNLLTLMTNKTSMAMNEMLKNSQKGFVILNDVPAIAEKYKLFEKAATQVRQYLNEKGDTLSEIEADEYYSAAQILGDALDFDPLSND